MSFRSIVWVVLMMFWLFFGGYLLYDTMTTRPTPMVFASSIIPWLCVAILGYEVYSGAWTRRPPQ